MAGRWEGKAAIVTGRAAGIGEAISHKFAMEAAKVVVNGLPGDPVDEVVQAVEQYGSEAVTYKGDISQTEEAQACLQAEIDRYSKLDILVNKAGVFLVIAETQGYLIDLFDRTLQMNLRSACLMTKFALPHLQQSRGNIVSAESEAGFNGLANNTTYGGTKSWMNAFMKGVAVEQAKYVASGRIVFVRGRAILRGPTKRRDPWTSRWKKRLCRLRRWDDGALLKRWSMFTPLWPLMKRATSPEPSG